MGSSALVAPPGGASPPGQPEPRPPKFDWLVIVVFAVACFAVALYLYKVTAFPIMISVFLAAGIASFVYRFLGGLEGTSIKIGIAAYGGSLGALVALAWFINGRLEKEWNNLSLSELHSVQQELAQERQKFRIPTEQMMVGEWRWIYARGGWEGELHFTMETNQLHFTGQQFKVIGENNPTKTPLYDLTNGTAHLTNLNELDLESDVYDHQFNRTFHWRSTAPFPLTLAFRGELRPTDKPELEQYAWGMMIYKWPAPGVISSSGSASTPTH